MTNFEYLKSLTKEETVGFLCNLRSGHGEINCDGCVAAQYCHMGHNGFIDWLDAKVEELIVE